MQVAQLWILAMRRPCRQSVKLALAALVLAFPAAPGLAQGTPPSPDARAGLGLMGTIPLYWGEAAGLTELLAGEADAHWARAQLEAGFRLHPLPALTDEELAGLRFLLLAQPRALAPAENVALDAWVRGGGRLLLFADPLLTGESRFALGDRRRPQDVILLSPILRHWGLELRFADDQAPGPALREIAGRPVPVNLPGHFAPVEDDAVGGGDCLVEGEALLANCTIGEGRVLVVADAALLDLEHPAPEAAPALAMLVERAFGTGESAGAPFAAPVDAGEALDSEPRRLAAELGAGPVSVVDGMVQSPP
jgi:hypothetical protein